MIIVRRGIGLFGGTFDPVHNGHLCVAREAARVMPLARIDFVLAPRPWQKAVATPVKERLTLLEEAIDGNPLFAVNTIELMRDGDTYTIDTLRQMRALVGPSTPLVLILGADQWKNFHTWRSWSEFLDFANIALCNRASEMPRAAPEVEAFVKGRFKDASEITNAPAGSLCMFSIPAHQASSTKIRELFARLPQQEAFRQLENWLPVKVAQRIAAQGLYSSAHH